MLKAGRPKKKPPVEASDDEAIFTFSFPASSSSSGLVRQGERREYPQTPEKEKEKENQKPAKRQQNLLLLLQIVYLAYFSLPFLQSNTYKRR